MKTWKVTFAALLCAALAVAAQAQTKVMNYSYDAAGNRTGRVTATLPEQQAVPGTAQASSVTPQKSSSAGASASAGNRTSGSSEATGSQTDGNPETTGTRTAGTPEAMPAKEETPAEAPSEKREGRQ